MDNLQIANEINNIMKYMKHNNIEAHLELKNIITQNNNGKYIKDMSDPDFIVLIDEIRWCLYRIEDEEKEILQKNIENFLFIKGFLYF
jgi:hypothetical protein